MLARCWVVVVFFIYLFQYSNILIHLYRSIRCLPLKRDFEGNRKKKKQQPRNDIFTTESLGHIRYDTHQVVMSVSFKYNGRFERKAPQIFIFF